MTKDREFADVDVGHDGPYAVSNGDIELKPRRREMSQRRNMDHLHEDMLRSSGGSNPSYYEDSLMPENDDVLTKL